MLQLKNLMEKTNILITSAGRRVSLINSFKTEIKELSLNAEVYCTDLYPELSSACQVSDNSFKVSRVTDDNYIEQLLEICIQNNIKVVIPTIDTELEILAKNETLFQEHHVHIIISDLDFIKKCRDKRLIHKFFDSIIFKRAEEYPLNGIKYPVFIKPSDGSRSQGLHLIKNKIDLTSELTENKKNMFLAYYNPDIYNEFTVDIYFNKNSKIIAIIPRERLFVRDGEVNKACTRKNEIVDVVKEKFKNVKGLKGCITLQVFFNSENKDIVGIEINPRFGGGFPLTYLSGANFPKWILEEYLLDKNIETYFDTWEEDLLMLRYDHEILVNGFKN